MKKQILTIVVIMALPNLANATGNRIGPNGDFDDDYANVEIATDAPFYEKAAIENDDATHIASTAYVKGAYNDAIAAVNKSYIDLVDGKQETLQAVRPNGTTSDILQEVYGKDLFIEDYDNIVENRPSSGSDMQLVTAAAVAGLVNNQRAVVYTTWDDDRDSATVQVPFVMASGN